jgi:drug/metabolite transporter (DMT)-like permease
MAVTACFILGERLDGDQIFGIVMMLLGLALVQIRHNTNA